MKKLTKIILTVLVVFACLIPVNAGKGEWNSGRYGEYYTYSDYSRPEYEFLTIDGITYYFYYEGYYESHGWNHVGEDEYFFADNGELARSKWIGNEWVGFLGKKEKNKWVDNGRYYVDSEGQWDPSKGTRKTGWKKDSGGWWFDSGEGTYPKNQFYEVDKKMYYFDSRGYMKTGWVQDSGYWYYFGSDGAMKQSCWVGNYYVNFLGRMEVNKWVDFKDYYVGADGSWIADKWQKDSKGWWYRKGDGTYPKDCEYVIGGKTYKFDYQGYLYMGWYTMSDNRYVWYYSDSSTGEVYKNRWAGDYWLDENGMMATNQWVDGGRYYVGADGRWVPGK